MIRTGKRGLSDREARRPARHGHLPEAFKRAVLASALVAVVVAVLVLVVGSPLALRQLASLHGVNWSQLSNIGQTYGAASALLTGLALIGVVGSMVFQVRAIRVSQEQATREQHAHLVEMALTDPVYQRAWGGLYDVYGSSDKYRQHGYVNLIVSYWRDHYVLGELRERELRGLAASLFRGESGRDFWADTRDMRLETAAGGRDRRFCRIMDEEQQKAILAGPPAVKAEVPASELSADRQPAWPGPVLKNGLILLTGVAGGIVLEFFVRRRGNQMRF
jgi:Family of unknown function (DUF6082)